MVSMGGGYGAVTPTLAGRVQTRALLLLVLGVPLCYTVGRALGDARSAVALVGYVLALGIVWDALYQHLQSYRWDQDWPPLLQWAAYLWEGSVLWLVLHASPLWNEVGLHGPPGVHPLPNQVFALHYTGVSLLMFAATQGPLRVLFPNWRFSGGRFR